MNPEEGAFAAFRIPLHVRAGVGLLALAGAVSILPGTPENTTPVSVASAVSSTPGPLLDLDDREVPATRDDRDASVETPVVTTWVDTESPAVALGAEVSGMAGEIPRVPAPAAAPSTSRPNTSASSSSSSAPVSTSVAEVKAWTAEYMLAEYGWGAAEFSCLDSLYTRESGWRWNADNPSSSAYGIPQALPGSKMASAGSDYLTNPQTQVRWGLGYIADRYGSPCEAWDHSESVGWY